LKKTEILLSVHEVVLLMLWYSSCNTVTSVKEKLLSQNPNFVYEKTKQTFEAYGIELLNIQETLTASL
jgi:hypothetical protein